jgi:signal transduction histidine kinase
MNAFSLSGLFTAITALSLIIILLIYGKTRLHKIWTFFNLAVLFWGIGCFMAGLAFSSRDALFAWRIAISGGLFIGVFFYHTMYIFSGIQKRIILLAIYAQAVFYFLLTMTTEATLNNWKVRFKYIYYPDATFFYTLMAASWVIVVILGHRELVLFFRNAKGIKRIQAKYLLGGFLVGFLGGGLTLVPAFDINIYPAGNFGIPIYCLISTFAILRYHLMDIKVAIKRTAAYSLAAGLLMGLFVIIVISMTRLFSQYVHVDTFSVNIAAALVIALLFNPLRNYIQQVIDKLFYKRSYDYFATVRYVSSTLASMFDLQGIYKFISDTIHEVLGLKDSYVLAALPDGEFGIVYRTSRRSGGKKLQEKPEKDEDAVKLSDQSNIVRLFQQSGDLLIKDDLPAKEERFGKETTEKISNELKCIHGEAAVPIFVDQKLTLLIILGGKLSGDMFTNEDTDLLRTISDQTAIALKNAKLYQEKVNSEKLASLGMMSGTFAHEIRNPLTSLKTFAQLMPEKYNDAEFRDTFSKIVVGEIEKIDALIRDLLDFSAEKKSSRVNNVNLAKFMDGIVNNVQGKLAFEKSKIQIQKKYHNNAINITGDEGKLRQAFDNIITNGCQAICGEGKLSIEIKQNGKSADVIIADTGEGIHPDDLPKIFDPFVTTKKMGVGLGLAISKRVIEDHNGKIHVQSQPGEGTTFTISLPAQSE